MITQINRAINQLQRSLFSEDSRLSFTNRNNSFYSDLKQVLVREVVSGIDLEDEDVVDSGLSPSVCVNAQQEDELDQQETTSIDPHQGPHVLEADEHSTW